ncbi:hypothetical protein Gotri_015976 [Gossypium trilobum]|uniref:Uncharacterized protein n=2 Tax=Gossypium TaxID=3633 RepID=A0A7J9E356_9ROSI|nr:hypothetical protein [Gossypium trilobum]MBA0799826.1 hypothetical protein [Gossypium harknessii]
MKFGMGNIYTDLLLQE